MESNNEIDILNTDMGGVKLREMSAITFLQWVAKKIDGVKAYSADAVSLSMLVSSPPMSRNMSDEKKLEIIGKLKKLGVTL